MPSANQLAASRRNLAKARAARLRKLKAARGGGAPLSARRSRVATSKQEYTRLAMRKGWLGKAKYTKPRARARHVYDRTGGNLAADRNWAGRLVPMSVWRKGKNPLRYDLGRMRKGRMVRIFD